MKLAKNGDTAARDQLLAIHRGRLRRMVAARLDSRLAGRVDPSDVVQETLAEASGKLDAYLRNEPLPFFPWLRRLAWERLARLHDHHLRVRKRAVTREQQPVGVSDESIAEFARFLSTSATGPVQRLLRAELKARVRTALEKLPPRDREVLVMRYLEGLSNAEIAASLEISEPAVRTRHTRALDRLHDLLLEYQENG
jgi:RNA polymerase sigma-70 factor (ECF subfamily)